MRMEVDVETSHQRRSIRRRWSAIAVLLGGIGYLVSWYEWGPRAPIVVQASYPATTLTAPNATHSGGAFPVAPSNIVFPTMSVPPVGSTTIGMPWTGPTVLAAGLPANVHSLLAHHGPPVTDGFPQSSNGRPWGWANPSGHSPHPWRSPSEEGTTPRALAQAGGFTLIFVKRTDDLAFREIVLRKRPRKNTDRLALYLESRKENNH